MRSVIAALTLFTAAAVHADDAPVPKALTPEEAAAYAAGGEALDLGRSAELNGYPGPELALQWKDELKLTEEQVSRLEAVVAEMKEQATSLGPLFVERELEIDKFFQDGAVDFPSLQGKIARASQIHGRLRYAYIAAHMKTAYLLNRDQVIEYYRLRGATVSE